MMASILPDEQCYEANKIAEGQPVAELILSVLFLYVKCPSTTSLLL